MTLFIRNKTVYIRHCEMYKTYRISTGIRVPDGAKMAKDGISLTGKDRLIMIINSQLMGVVAKATEILNGAGDIKTRLKKLRIAMNPDYAEDDGVDLARYARKFAMDAKSGEMLTTSGTRYSQASISYMNSVAMLLEKMAERGYCVNLMAMDAMNQPVEIRRKNQFAMNQYIERLKMYMVNEGYKVNSQKLYLSHVESLITRAEKEYSIRVLRDTRIQWEDAPVVAMPPDVVKAFLNMEPVGFDDLHLRFAYEVSFVILVTSLRVRDALRLTASDFRIINDQPMLLGYLNNKTGERTNCPIPRRLYDMAMANDKTFGSVYCMQIDNTITADSILLRTMPRLFKMVPGADELISISRLNPDGVTYNKQVKPLYEMAKPHMLRRSAITAMLHAGVPDRVVKYTSGHTGNSKSFERYVAYVDKTYNDSMTEYQKRLMG